MIDLKFASAEATLHFIHRQGKAPSIEPVLVFVDSNVLWVPIVVATGSKSAFQWSETVISAALTAGAWVVADSYRGIPWLAVNKR